MGMGQEQVGNIPGSKSALLQTFLQGPAHAEGPAIDHRQPARRADQRDRRPAEPAMAYGLARVTLNHDIDANTGKIHSTLPDRV